MRAPAIRIVSTFAMLGALPALAVFAASWHWLLDLAACFVVQSLGGLLLAAAVLFALRARRRAAACLGGALLAALGTAPDWCRGLPAAPAASAPTPPAKGPAAAPPVRVLAMNLLFGTHDRLADALAVIRAEQADVLFCCEATPEWTNGLAAGLPDHPHRLLAAEPGCFGVALFSRLPLRSARTIPLAHAWAPAVLAVVDVDGAPLGLLGVHTPPPGPTAARCRLRDAALAAIPAAVRELPPAHLVIGDHNATPWNPALRALLADGALRPATFADWLPTWPTQWPVPLRIPIDHAFVGPGLEVLDVHTGSAFGSDHLPLCVTVRAISPR
jgi:endonuclease/exonuclease/phosphatase (EEP) superfamily protein YafD